MKSSYAIAVALMLPVSHAAFADDDDRPRGGSKLSGAAKMLMAKGFTHTRKVKFKDGELEFKGARHASGAKYDVKVRNGRIVEIDD